MNATLGNASVTFMDVWSTEITHGERGPYSTIGYFTTQQKARAFGIGKSWYGSDGSVLEHQAVKINESIYIISSAIDLDGKLAEARELLRKKALSKLSAEEISVLGIKP